MTCHAEMHRVRKMARSLHLKLMALELELRVMEDPEDAAGYRIQVRRPTSASERHADRILRRVEENKPGLVNLLIGH